MKCLLIAWMILAPLSASAYVVKADASVQNGAVCASENESAGGSALGMSAQCCEGLTFISTYQRKRFQEHHQCAKAQEEAKFAPPGMGGSCSKCGDGICKEPEDSCSCPSDCKK